MIYDKPLPKLDKLRELALAVGSYPVTGQRMVLTAKRLGYSPATIEFLQLFPADGEFESRADFVTRCDDLIIMIEQQRHTPDEAPRSPQD